MADVSRVAADQLRAFIAPVFAAAGAPEARRTADRLRGGIPISEVVLDELRATAQSLGAPAERGS